MMTILIKNFFLFVVEAMKIAGSIVMFLCLAALFIAALHSFPFITIGILLFFIMAK